MKRVFVILSGIILVILATTVGLTATSSPPAENVSVVIETACTLTVTAGNYDYGTLPAFTSGVQSETVTLNAVTNIATYRIAFRAGGVVQMGGLPATDIVLADFAYGATSLTAADQTIITGTRTALAGVDHDVQLDLTLDGDEAPGTYTTTVIFTMTAPNV